MKILLTHAYSAHNKGDGLLVQLAIDEIRTLYPGAQIELVALHPGSFQFLSNDIKVVPILRNRFFWSKEFLRIFSRSREYAGVVGVGGGYLRARGPLSTIKVILVHLPQLILGSRLPSIYLPQSIGPLPKLIGWIFKALLRTVQRVYVRDDLSFSYLSGSNVRRCADMAVTEISKVQVKFPDEPVSNIPIVSTKVHLSHKAIQKLSTLCSKLGPFETFIQSSVASNNDSQSNLDLKPVALLQHADVMNSPGRIVVTVRLHAALMAIAAGHWVIHLAYERKGFGAFEDLGISDFVHSVNKFDVDTVVAQINSLTSSAEVRSEYQNQILSNHGRLISQLEARHLEMEDLWG